VRVCVCGCGARTPACQHTGTTHMEQYNKLTVGLQPNVVVSQVISLIAPRARAGKISVVFYSSLVYRRIVCRL
jgi:hypothetical protein